MIKMNSLMKNLIEAMNKIEDDVLKIRSKALNNILWLGNVSGGFN